ncbi:MAG: hypothetical protein ACRDSJ_12535, partial [Rubrobacteraceae bacterium]
MTTECGWKDRVWASRLVWWAVVGLLGVFLAMMAGTQGAWAATRTVPTSPGCATIQDCVDT